MAALMGQQLHIYGVVGISAPWYLKDPVCGSDPCPWRLGHRTPQGVVRYGEPLEGKFPGLRSLLADVDPKTVIVELGTNDAGECNSSNPAGKMLEMVKMIKAKGLLARVIQHEVDHLDGILFIDRAKNIRQEF